MKRNLALVLLIVVGIAALALMPALAKPQDLKPTAGDTDKLVRMGKDALHGQYIVVLDQDSSGKNGDLFDTARTATDLSRTPTLVAILST